MPVNDVVADDFAHVYKQATNWTNAVSDDTGTSTSGTGNPSINVYFLYTPANIYINYRTFGAFDLSSLSGTVTSVSLILTKSAGNDLGLPIFVVKGSDNKSASSGNAAGIPFTTDHYLSGVAGFDGDDYPYEAAGVSEGGDGSYKEYTSEIAASGINAISSDAQYTIDLNSDAVTDANSVIGTSTKFFVAILSKYDKNNTHGSDGTFPNNSTLGSQGHFTYPESHSTSGFRPLLRVTTADATLPNKINIKGGTLNVKGGSVIIK